MHLLTYRRLAVASASVLALAGLAAGPASAASSGAASGVLVTAAAQSCGASTRLITPKSGVIESGADEAALAAALSVPADDPVLLHAEARHSHWLSSITCKIMPGTHSALSAAGNATPADTNGPSPNWAGYEAATPDPDFVEGEWNVPSVGSPPGDVSQYSSTWVGIGGDANPSAGQPAGELVQAGTEQDSLCTVIVHGACGAEATQYYAWYEQDPYENEVEISNMTISPGDDIWASDGTTDNETYPAICDDTTNVCVDPTQTLAAAPGDSSEWIVERSEVSGAFPPLADFGTVTFADSSETWYEGGVATTPQEAGATAYDMYNGSDLLANTGPLDASGQGFTVTYDASE